MDLLTSTGVIKLGHRPGISFIEKFGRNPSVATAGEDIHDAGGIYVFPTLASKINVQSTSAEDGAGTLTGALSISIQGLDQNYNQIIEMVILNGLTTVSTVNQFIRVFRMLVETTGSAGANVGIITAGSQAEVLTLATIRAGKGQTNMALYTIPKGHKGFLKKWYISILKAGTETKTVAADCDIFRRSFGKAWRSTQPISIQSNGSGLYQYEFFASVELEAKTDIVINAEPSSTSDISAGFNIVIIHA